MKREQGTALVSAMLIVVVIGMVTSMSFERNRLLDRERVSAVAARKAFHAADGGIEWALHALSLDPKSTGGVFKLGECELAVRITHEGDGSAAITARATIYLRGPKALPVTHQEQTRTPPG